MSKKKFTKGEWFTHIVEEPFSERAFVRSKNDEGVLTLLETRSIANFEEQKANAVLISAAPDMLEALNDLLIYCRLNSTSQLEPLIRNADSAIKKATS